VRATISILHDSTAAVLCWTMIAGSYALIWVVDRIYGVLGWLESDEDGEHWEARR
jgi:hypothetical protein